MGIYEKFGTDVNLEADGVWYDVCADAVVGSEDLQEWLADQETSGIRVASTGTGNKLFLKETARLASRSGRTARSQEKMLRENAEVFARACVRDWRGPALVDKDGQPMQFSREACARVLVDLPELYVKLLEVARGTENYRAEVMEEESKN